MFAPFLQASSGINQLIIKGLCNLLNIPSLHWQARIDGLVIVPPPSPGGITGSAPSMPGVSRCLGSAPPSLFATPFRVILLFKADRPQ